MDKWISTKSALPEDGEHVIGYCLSDRAKIWYAGMVRHSKSLINCPFWDDSSNSHPREVTHWMPLPAAPEK